MNILLLGSGGREAALAWKIAQSPLLTRLFIAPGNAGTALSGTNVKLSPLDFPAVAEFVKTNAIDMLVAGNEDPLVTGLRDYMQEHCAGLLIVGPGADGAALEGSKDFAKRFMTRHGIPTAKFRSFTAETLPDALAFLDTLQPPYVLKADGLAAGKGVIIPETLPEAQEALREMLGGKFGKASATVVIEEFLKGIECSVFVLTDGTGAYRILPVAKDYKRRFELDKGPNTGGMGAMSPVPFADEKFMEKVRERIVEPTLNGLREEGIDYRGFIFLGLINVGGDPMVIEYNVRMGDPETEAVMLRIESDLVPLLEAAAKGNLGDMPLDISPMASATVVMVSDGYPGAYKKGFEISGIEAVGVDEIETVDEDCPERKVESVVFQAGTAFDEKGATVTSGGRVLAVSALAPTPEAAVAACYRGVGCIFFEGASFRRDIGADLLSLSI